MNFKREQVAGTTYVLYELGKEEQMDQLSLGMLTNNRIPNILATTFYVQDNLEILRYNVSSKVNLKTFLTGTINKKQILSILNSLATGIIATGEYMLEPGQIVMDEENIYVNVGTGECYLMVLPIENADYTTNLPMFFKEVLFGTRFDSNDNGDYIVALSNYLNGAENFSIVDFKRLVQSLIGSDLLGQQGPAVNAGNVQQGTMGSSVQQGAMGMQMGGGSQPVQPQMAQPQPMAQPVQPVMAHPVTPTPSKAAVQPQQTPNKKAQNKGKEKPQQPVVQPVQPASSQQVPQNMAKPQMVSQNGQSFFVPNTTPQVPPAQNQKKEKKSMFGFGKKKEAKPVPQKNNAIPTAANTNPGMVKPQGNQPMGQPVMSPQPMGQPVMSSQPMGQPVMSSQPMGQPVMSSQPMGQPMMIQQPQGTMGYGAVQPMMSAMPPVQSGETTILQPMSDSNATTVLGVSAAGQPRAAYVTRSKSSEKIVLNKPMFKFGKEKSYVDYCIMGNPAVSRSHADIIRKDGGYVIVDNNSLNHTYVDGQQIMSSEEVKLRDGCRILLADEEFIFHA